MCLHNLVSRAPHSIVEHLGELYPAYSGLLTSPFSGFRPETALEYGAKWAADNGCFLRYAPDRILSMLRRYRGIDGCLWVTLPDVVSNAQETMRLYHQWSGTYKEYGYKLALVAQNGIQHYDLDWQFDCLFIGGDNEFKYSGVVVRLIEEAKSRGKWVHMGRVNTPERILYARWTGCNSFDGTHFTRVPSDVTKYIPQQTISPDLARLSWKSYHKTIGELE